MSKLDKIKHVANNYNHYLAMKDWSKGVVGSDVVMSQTRKGSSQRIADVPLQSPPEKDQWSLKIVTDVDKTCRFSAILFDFDFLGDIPCFRFDGDGGRHKNPFKEGVPLCERFITTPHFHMYDETGASIAYKTEDLKLNQTEIMKSWTNILHHFCAEENIQILEDVELTSGEFLFQTPNNLTDPLSGVIFDE